MANRFFRQRPRTMWKTQLVSRHVVGESRVTSP